MTNVTWRQPETNKQLTCVSGIDLVVLVKEIKLERMRKVADLVLTLRLASGRLREPA